MEQIQTNNNWTTLEKYAFRVCLLFFSTFVLNNGIIPYVSEWWTSIGHSIGHWFKAIIFGMSNVVDHEMNGSGDTSDDWAAQIFFLLFAFVGAAIWTLLDKKTQRYELWYYWLRVAVRYCLAITMLSYGIAKLVPDGQFPYPSLNSMTRPLGNFTPMGIAWQFFGFSYPYSFFGGLMEFVGGVLLLFRRTTLAGVLLLITVIVNIVMINYAYDVAVKLYSTIYLMAALFLLAKDFKSLKNYFLSSEILENAPEIPQKWFRIARIALKSLVLLVALGFPIFQIFFQNEEDMGMKKSPLYGIYEVERFEKNQKEALVPINDTMYWKRIVIGESWGDDNFYGKIQLSVAKALRATFNSNDTTKQISIKVAMDSTHNLVATYRQIDSTYLQLDGLMNKKDTVKIRLKKSPMPPLHTHGFHWISERPHNY
jgi:multidrug transporter EmrE-like cation transporter